MEVARISSTVIEAIVVVVIQLWFFTISTTAFAVRRWGRDALPPLGKRIANAFGMPSGRLSLIGELFWFAIAALLLVGVPADGIALDRGPEILAGLVALFFDAAWLAYLVRQRPRRLEG